MVGQQASGKTNLMASVLFNTNAAVDLAEGPDRIGSPSISVRPVGDALSPDARTLQTHYDQMLFGRTTPGTDDVRRYEATLRYVDAPQPSGRVGFRRAPVEEPVELEFDIVDGRGGDVAKTRQFAGEENEEEARDNKAKLDRYRDGLNDSIGAVICMPIRKDEFDSVVVTNFNAELELMRQRKAKDPQLPRLSRVAICFTMYELEFLSEGGGAIDRAVRPEVFRERMMDNANLSMFKPFVLGNRGPDAFDIRFFPTSSYGFVSEGGSPNYYDYAGARGLKARAVDPVEDYGDIALPGYKDHFPIPLSQGEASALWFPFNVAPPILFALTGRITGPVSLAPHELGFAAEPA
ncbi:MAG: hypothetical protein AAF914_10090 [Pseudomonadota bacterium]